VKKKLSVIFFIIIALLVTLGILKNSLIKSAIVVGASKVVGAPVKVDHFSISFIKQSVRIKGFRLYNPEGYPDEPMVNIPEISVDYDLLALLQKKLHIPLMVLNLEEVVVIKDKEGQLNVNALKIAEPAGKEEETEAKPKEEAKKPSEPMPMQIDEVTLSIGRVVMKDFTQGDTPKIETFDIDLKDKTYKNITSAQQLGTLVLGEALKGSVLKGGAIYGATALLGVGFLPAGVTGVLIGKDSSQAEFNLNYDKVFDAAVKIMEKIGTISKQDPKGGIIKGKVNGSSISIEFEKKSGKNIVVTVSARKYMIPKPKVAGGILYQIQEILK